MTRNARWTATMTALAASGLLTVSAGAHSTSAVGGISAGVAHPLTGVDHVLAMVSVGLLGARMGGRAIWALPAAFVGFMAVGGVGAGLGMQLPAVEHTIAASVVVLGVLLAHTIRLPRWAAGLLVGFFALFHGHAHMTDLVAAAGVSYIVGFLAATAALHVVGLATGILFKRITQIDLLSAMQPTRWVGLGVAAVGVMIWTRLI